LGVELGSGGVQGVFAFVIGMETVKHEFGWPAGISSQPGELRRALPKCFQTSATKSSGRMGKIGIFAQAEFMVQNTPGSGKAGTLSMFRETPRSPD
jgi:hypothetical protein